MSTEQERAGYTNITVGLFRVRDNEVPWSQYRHKWLPNVHAQIDKHSVKGAKPRQRLHPEPKRIAVATPGKRLPSGL